nr:phosphoprotein ECPP44-like [Ipomoea trifida]
MAEECHRDQEEQVVVKAEDRGLLDFLGKKEEEKKPHCAEEEAISGEFGEKVHVSEPPHGVEYKEEKKTLHRSSSSSSSSEEEKVEVDTSVPVEKCDDEEPAEEKKGFLDKIKEKLPGGGNKKAEEEVAPPPPPAPAAEHHEGEPKKGFLDKIKEKLPGP